MSLDTCITNVGEYFSSHYLDSTFTKDVKDLLDRWNKEGSQSPPRKFQSLSQTYFRAKTQAIDEDDPARRNLTGDLVRGWHATLLDALGYHELTPVDIPVEGAETYVPAMGRVARYNKPWLVVCQAHFCLPDGSLKDGRLSEDPLSMSPVKDDLVTQSDHKLCSGDWARLAGRVLTEEDAPRWLMLLAGSTVLLLDRNTFAQGRYLAFDLDDAFGRKEKATFNHIAAFLAYDALCPDGESDEVLLDKLEEQSHKFTHGVTESLQVAVREAIELLVNEWISDRRSKSLPYTKLRKDEAKLGEEHGFEQTDDGDYLVTAEQLRREALAFVYRLLFCFYAEARGGELEILPIEDPSYRLGYSLESLRDLEQVPLTSSAREGTYFHEHLKQLFRLIHEGFQPDSDRELFSEHSSSEFDRAFTMKPLTATLFSPESTPLLGRARLSNGCLQGVIHKLSLSKQERNRPPGRVNYAELGINQLGAVYEGLLSYKGMFASEDLIQVKPASKSFGDKKTPTWFVPKDRQPEFESEEIERLDDGKPRIYTTGTFILHLNGIDREQSASYYTPEVLTKCLVEEALRELLKDYTPEDADKILNLKICEPAMGSGAFLNEASRQLAERYLELKQKQLQEQFPEGSMPISILKEETNKVALPAGAAPTIVAENKTSYISSSASSPEMISTSIEPSRYNDELRRVQHYIATRNIYGVDLNETAVELGALSLWLGSIHRLLRSIDSTTGRENFKSGATPWFGLRLRCGNSLIGARRAVWTRAQLERGEQAWKSKDIQNIQSDIEAFDDNDLENELRGKRFTKDTLNLLCKIKWNELPEDSDDCRNLVVQFCECARDKSTAGLGKDNLDLYQRRHTTWRAITSQKNQDDLLALYDLLPTGRMRDVERISFDIYKAIADQHENFKAGLPRLLKPGESRGNDEIYHFLVPDPDMIPTHSDKLMKSFWKENCEAAKKWLDDNAKPKWTTAECSAAADVCELVDHHWQQYACERAAALAATACTSTVWPVPSGSPEAIAAGPSLAEQERICAELESTSGSFQRLRLVMDTWCALWFWPLGEVDSLPGHSMGKTAGRAAFLQSCKLLLAAEAPTDPAEIAMTSAALGFEVDVLLAANNSSQFSNTSFQSSASDEAADPSIENRKPKTENFSEAPDVEQLATGVPWFGVSTEISLDQNFHHWELAFVEVLGEAASEGGFDLIVGNPPWMRGDWSQSAVLCEMEAKLGVNEAKSAELTKAQKTLLAAPNNRQLFTSETNRSAGVVGHITSPRLFQLLTGVRANLYKVFMVQSWGLAEKGVVGLLHPDGPFEDTNGGSMREEIYTRLRSHYQFRNELKLFPDVGNVKELSINIYGVKKVEVAFKNISNLFHPHTVDGCYSHASPHTPVPGMKLEDGSWDLRPHSGRLVTITKEHLTLFRDLLESSGCPVLQTRLPRIHSEDITNVLRVLVKSPNRLHDYKGKYYPTQMLNEAPSQQDGVISRQVDPAFQPKKSEDWVISGPHFNLATPFFQTPKTRCLTHRAYDEIDLEAIPAEFYPRAVYRPGNNAGNTQLFEKTIESLRPKCLNGKRLVDFYSYGNKSLINCSWERTLLSYILPKGASHINMTFSLTFSCHKDMALVASTFASLPVDFLMKTTGKPFCSEDILQFFPVPKTIHSTAVRNRGLRLNCLASSYDEL
ncbi:hypothetical protein N9Y42_06670, partial [Mariniblastus sp.]|nr:hypothetical protein [Mariniblastus sp.]